MIETSVCWRKSGTVVTLRVRLDLERQAGRASMSAQNASRQA